MDFSTVQTILMYSVLSVLAMAVIIVGGYAAIWAVNKCIRLIAFGSTTREDVVWNREMNRWEWESGKEYNGVIIILWT